jgi:hypothetical protein
MKSKIMYLILSFFVVLAAHGLAEPTSSTTPAGKAIIDGGSGDGKLISTGSGGKAEQVTSIQSELNTEFKSTSHNEYRKGKPIDLTIQLNCYNDKNRLIYIYVTGELPPEIEFISADKEAKYDNDSRKISWNLRDLYETKKNLAFSVYSRKGGNFEIPTTINARMKLEDGREISGYKDADQISLTAYNYAPEIIQNHHPNSIFLPVLSDSSVRVLTKDIDNDCVKCSLYDDNFEKIIPIGTAANSSGTYENTTWNLPFFLWGTRSYSMIADDGEKKEFTIQGEFPSEMNFEVVYGLNNLVFLLALCAIGPLILVIVQYRSYTFNKRERSRSILSKEMDRVIEPLYFIFKGNKDIVNYMSLPISHKIGHHDYYKLKRTEERIIDLLEKGESNIDQTLWDIYKNFNKYYNENDSAKAKSYASLMFDHISSRYRYLKDELNK